MKNGKFILISLALILHSTLVHSYRLKLGTVLTESSTNLTPAWFYAFSPNGKYVAFHANKGGWKNFIMNIETEKTTVIPGFADPMFVNDEIAFVYYLDSSLEFYNVTDLVTYGVNSKKLYKETGFKGAYPSAGVISDNESKTVFRVLMEGNNGKHQTRLYTALKNQNGSYYKIIPTDKITGLCSNQKIKLPMMSKDARELSGLDLNSGSSSIFKINKNLTCSKTLDFKKKVGKIFFSFDKKYLAFHVITKGGVRWAENWVEYPHVSSFTADVVYYDRNKKRSYQVTANRKSNSMYPHFTTEGYLVFGDIIHGGNEDTTYTSLDLNLR